MKKFSNNNQISTANKNNEIDVICKFRLNIENRVGWKILEANISSSKKKHIVKFINLKYSIKRWMLYDGRHFSISYRSNCFKTKKHF